MFKWYRNYKSKKKMWEELNRRPLTEDELRRKEIEDFVTTAMNEPTENARKKFDSMMQRRINEAMRDK